MRFYIRWRERNVSMRFPGLGRNKKNFISLFSILERFARVEHKAIDLEKKERIHGYE